MLKIPAKKILLAGLLFPLLTIGGAASAAEETPAAPTRAMDASNLTAHISPVYGYMLFCPQKPNEIVPAQELYEDKRGDVLIFDSEEHNIKKAWVILKNGWDENALPDLNKITPEETETLLKNMAANSGYEGIALVELTPDNKAVFAVTGREIEIDTTGDGVPDTLAKADTQNALVFFRGNHGGRFTAILIDNPIPRQESVVEFQQCLGSFSELTKEEYEKMAQGAGKLLAGTGATGAANSGK